MVSVISFFVMLLGSLNWLSIGMLQYDFIAGLFGSQSNIFSRIVYVIIGVCAIVVCFALIKTKGKIKLPKKMEENTPSNQSLTNNDDLTQTHNNSNTTK